MESRSGIEPRSLRLPTYRLTARPNRLTKLYNLTLTEFKPSSTDAPTEAPQWPRCLLPAGVSDRFSPAYLQLDYVETDQRDDVSQGVTLSPGRWDCSVTQARLEQP